MAGNVIYRGPIAREPQTIDRVCTGALKPGACAYLNAGVLTVATATQNGGKIYIVNNRREIGQDVATAYTSGDLANAYEAVPGEVYQCRMAALTYAKGDKLALTASGRLTNAPSVGDATVAYFDDTAGAKSADDLCDVIWAGPSNTRTS